MSDTLLLNQDGQPVSVLPLSTLTWQEAIKYLCLDRVTVLEWYDDWIVSSPTWETRVPAVMMAKEFVRRSRRPRFSRHNIYLRDQFTCQYCGVQFQKHLLTLDHVKPASKGGAASWENLVAACQPCNHQKADQTRGWKPINQPYQPTYYQLAANRKHIPFEIKHPSWRDYL